MKSMFVLISILLINVALFAQGIKFEKTLSWPEICEKAQKENKYIFVDCYTTWCGPCKKMDQEVYLNDTWAIL